MSSTFPDHFSSVADAYREFRPTYPDELFDFLAAQVETHDLAWDCAAGSGQATAGLARRFRRVVATDGSPSQLRNLHVEGAQRVVSTAEAVSLRADSVDLVTVAQALHWLRLEELWGEVRRITKPGAAFAAWTYSLCRVSPDMDALLDEYQDGTLGEYWPHERRHVDNLYATLPFPFAEIPAPVFQMKSRMTLAQMIGYLGTWSARRRYIARHGEDPLPAFAARLTEAWGYEGARELTWPVGLRVGHVH